MNCEPTTKSPRRGSTSAVFAVLLLGGMLSGCRVFPFCSRDEPVVCQVDMSWMSDVTIVPVCDYHGGDDVLLAFCGELATALHAHSVADIRIRDDCRVPCPADAVVPASCPVESCTPDSTYVLAVNVSDFRPYRPLRLAVDVRLIQTADQREIARVVRVFYGSQEAPLRESPRRFILFRERQREARVDAEAYTAFQSNSPSALLTCSARQVTEQLSFQGPDMSMNMAPPPLDAAESPPAEEVLDLDLDATSESRLDPEQVPPRPPAPAFPGPAIPDSTASPPHE